jgi:hypothetical protein
VDREGRLRMLERGRVLIERLDRDLCEADLAPDDPEGLAESYRRCAREAQPIYDHLKFDFGDGAPAVFERLLLPYVDAGHRTTTVVGLVVFTGEIRSLPTRTSNGQTRGTTSIADAPEDHPL